MATKTKTTTVKKTAAKKATKAAAETTTVKDLRAVQSLTAPLVVTTEVKGKVVERTFNKPNGPVAQIIALYQAGHSQKDIVAAGYNKSTVYRQVLEYNKFIGTNKTK